MKLAHLSDLHFGTEEDDLVEALLEKLHKNNPDLIVVSGDFAQIGSSSEFQKAKEFLEKLPCQAVCVPGNHDVPARDLYQRFFHPYKKYKAYINQNLCPVFKNDDVLVAGLNSARRALPHWNWANGAISEAQRQHIINVFGEDDADQWRICTFHHPVHKVEDMPLDVTVFGRKRTMNVIQSLKIDLVLTGHVHHASLKTIGDGFHQTVYLSASTALSRRTRGQENGFNLIHLEDSVMKIDMIKLQGQEFVKAQYYEIRK